MPYKIEKLYAWVTTDDDGDDALPAVRTDMGFLPMIGSDKEMIESLRQTAMTTMAWNGRPIRLVEFGTMKVIEVHSPNDPQTHH